MFQLIGEVDGVEAMNRAFNRTEGFVVDMRNFAAGLSAEFYKAETEQFESEGQRGASGKWAPLQPAYAKYKAINFPGKGILQREGTLKASLTSREAFDAIFTVSRDEIVLGTKVPYAMAHQRGRGRLRARPVISLSEVQKRRMQKAVQQELVAFTRKAGFQVEERAA